MTSLNNDTITLYGTLVVTLSSHVTAPYSLSCYYYLLLFLWL